MLYSIKHNFTKVIKQVVSFKYKILHFLEIKDVLDSNSKDFEKSKLMFDWFWLFSLVVIIFTPCFCLARILFKWFSDVASYKHIPKDMCDCTKDWTITFIF